MKKNVFLLTRQAARSLREIYSRSVDVWGSKIADQYMDEIYVVMNNIAQNPKCGLAHKKRAAPFLMVPAGKHFIVYDQMKTGVVVLAVLHQRRNIERLIFDLEPSFLSEIQAIRKKINNRD